MPDREILTNRGLKPARPFVLGGSTDWHAISRKTSGRTCGCLLGIIGCLSLAAGGCSPQCEPPVGRGEVPVGEASLSLYWSEPGHDRMTVVVADGPYRVSDAAVALLVEVLRDQAGIEVAVVEGGDTGLPDSGVLAWRDVVQAGVGLAPQTSDPVLIITVVSDTDYPTATYGFVSWQNQLLAVMAIHGDAAQSGAVWPVTPEVIESLTVVHEAGHWLEVPARDHHLSSVDYLHCTNAQCVMYSGGRLGMCGIMANLLTGVPRGFGPACAEELAEMRRRRDAGGSG